jgi:transposase
VVETAAFELFVGTPSRYLPHRLDRQQKHRLAVLRHADEVTGNVAATCRYYGITRQRFYTWPRRFEAEGVEGLNDRSHRPKTSPNATQCEVVGQMIYLWQNYHFGPEKIAMYLKRCHGVRISNSGVWRILNRWEMNRLPASQKHKAYDQRWKRYEKQLPGHRVQIDVKFIEPLISAARGKRRNRFYHRAEDLSEAQPGHRDPVRRLRHAKAPFPGRGLQTDTEPGQNSAPPSTGICSTRASTTSRSNLEGHG